MCRRLQQAIHRGDNIFLKRSPSLVIEEMKIISLRVVDCGFVVFNSAEDTVTPVTGHGHPVLVRLRLGKTFWRTS